MKLSFLGSLLPSPGSATIEDIKEKTNCKSGSQCQEG